MASLLLDTVPVDIYCPLSCRGLPAGSRICLLSGLDGKLEIPSLCTRNTTCAPTAQARVGRAHVAYVDRINLYLPAGKGRLGANGAHGSSPLLHGRSPQSLIDSNHTYRVLKAMIRTCLASVQEMAIVETTYFCGGIRCCEPDAKCREQASKWRNPDIHRDDFLSLAI